MADTVPQSEKVQPADRPPDHTLPPPDFSTWQLQTADYKKVTDSERGVQGAPGSPLVPPLQLVTDTPESSWWQIGKDAANQLTRSSVEQILKPAAHAIVDRYTNINDADDVQKVLGDLVIAGAVVWAFSRRAAERRDTVVPRDRPIPDLSAQERESLRATANVDINALQLDRLPAESTERAQQRLRGLPINPAYDLEFEKPGRSGPYADWQDFARRGIESRSVAVRHYTVAGHPGTFITVEEDYAKQLDEVRQLRIAAEKQGGTRQEIKAQQEAEAKLKEHPLRGALLPEDVVQQLDQLPNRSLVKHVIIQGRPNPQDAWHSQDYQPGFASEATADGNGVITFYGAQGASLSRNMRHEWAHLLEGGCKSRASFDAAASVERDGFYQGSYPRRNDRENWAVHFEELTDHDADRFLLFCKEAPVRSLVMAMGLRETLDAVPADQRSPHHKQLLERVKYVEEHVKPKAIDKLIENLKTNGTQDGASGGKCSAAISLLHYVADMRAVPALTKFAKDHPGHRDGQSAYFAARETLRAHGTHQQRVEFLREMKGFTDAGSRGKGNTIQAPGEMANQDAAARASVNQPAKSGELPRSPRPAELDKAAALSVEKVERPASPAVASAQERTELLGKPGPGISPESIAAIQKIVAETGVPVVIFGSRQTGWSPVKQRPFTAESDVDLGLIGEEREFDKLTNHPAFGDGTKIDIPGVKHFPMMFFDSEADALNAGYLIIRPKFDAAAVCKSLNAERLEGLRVTDRSGHPNKQVVIQYLKSHVGADSGLPPHRQEEVARLLAGYEKGDAATVRSVHEFLGIKEVATNANQAPGAPVAGARAQDRAGADRRVELADRTPKTADAHANREWEQALSSVKETRVISRALERANMPTERAQALERDLLSEDRERVARAKGEIHERLSPGERDAFRRELRDCRGREAAAHGGKLGAVAMVLSAVLPHVLGEEEDSKE